MKQKKDNTNKKKQIHDFKTNQKAERSPTHVNKNRKATSEVKKLTSRKVKQERLVLERQKMSEKMR